MNDRTAPDPTAASFGRTRLTDLIGRERETYRARHPASACERLCRGGRRTARLTADELLA